MTLIWLRALFFFVGVLQWRFSQSGEADRVVQSGFAPGVTRSNLKNPLGASASNRIGLDLCWSRLAALYCWPRLPSSGNERR